MPKVELMLDQIVKALKQAFWISPVMKSCVSSGFVLRSTEEDKNVLKEQMLLKSKPYIWESAMWGDPNFLAHLHKKF